MQHIMQIEFWPIVALGAVLCAITVEFGVKRSKLHRRAVQLRTANHLLQKHFAALTEFVEHPAAPAKIKEKLLIFSKVISDRARFLGVVKQVCADMEEKKTSGLEAKGYEKDLLHLKTQHPDLAQIFEVALNSGLAAMFLRFPEVGELLEATMAKVYADPRQEIAMFAGAIRNDRATRSDDIPMEAAWA